jgi:hypothetical protein
MNERIKLLWEEAAKTTQGDSWEEQTKFIERFAELIVRECYEHCKDQLMDEMIIEAIGLTYNDGVGDCAIGLLQHFGVE